ncbi:hypothetical protein OS493_032796 [Desmophyllum pertusum]|uniref:Uncharacterized protein n=1 Tax=Desmophyllum pertusum TaxID=174260 RepID=A0A9X0CV45_9CNID|nr:hypothetical protein OS493_032796 [Desmophyllum pertusum]
MGKIRSSQLRKGARSIVALLPLLGVTYLLGFFVEFHDAVIYAFIVVNSTQIRAQKISSDRSKSAHYPELRWKVHQAKPATHTEALDAAVDCQWIAMRGKRSPPAAFEFWLTTPRQSSLLVERGLSGSCGKIVGP